MKKNIIIYIFTILAIVGILIYGNSLLFGSDIQKNKAYELDVKEWNTVKAYSINKTNIVANIDSRQIKSNVAGIYMNDSMALMIPVDQIREAFDCAVLIYND